MLAFMASLKFEDVGAGDNRLTLGRGVQGEGGIPLVKVTIKLVVY